MACLLLPDLGSGFLCAWPGWWLCILNHQIGGCSSLLQGLPTACMLWGMLRVCIIGCIYIFVHFLGAWFPHQMEIISLTLAADSTQKKLSNVWYSVLCIMYVHV